MPSTLFRFRKVQWKPADSEIQDLREALRAKQRPRFPVIDEVLAKKREEERKQERLAVEVG